MGNPKPKTSCSQHAKKIKKDKGAQPNDLEQQVAQAFVDLEINNEELRPTLKNLHIVGAREVVVNKSTAAIVVFIPYRLRELFRKNQVRLVCELEKKFSGQHVVLIAKRTRYTVDGNKHMKIELENPYEVSEKLDTFSAVYSALTGKAASFSLPAQDE